MSSLLLLVSPMWVYWTWDYFLFLGACWCVCLPVVREVNNFSQVVWPWCWSQPHLSTFTFGVVTRRLRYILYLAFDLSAWPAHPNRTLIIEVVSGELLGCTSLVSTGYMAINTAPGCLFVSYTINLPHNYWEITDKSFLFLYVNPLHSNVKFSCPSKPVS